MADRKRIGIFAFALLGWMTPLLAQDYPSRPITLMVPYAAGGPPDIVARSLGQTMGKALQQTIIIENVVGAGGTIAPTRLKNSAPDGYKLLLAHIAMSTGPALNDLLGAQVDLLCDQTAQTTQYIKSARVKAYGATSASRLDTLKELPTLAEAGLPGFEVVV